MDDEVSDMTASFHTAARKDRSNSIRRYKFFKKIFIFLTFY